MLCEIDRARELGFDAEALRDVDHVDELRDFVRRLSRRNASRAWSASTRRQIRELAHAFASAPSAAVHVSTGVNMGRQGMLAYWLAQMLSLVTGNLDREGGNILPARGVAPMVLPRRGRPAMRTTFLGRLSPSARDSAGHRCSRT